MLIIYKVLYNSMGGRDDKVLLAIDNHLLYSSHWLIGTGKSQKMADIPDHVMEVEYPNV